jgi:tRNA (Thr-GGU) A37 N-methylase
MGNEEGEEAAPFAEMGPDRPNPVTQSEMDAGSVDLF